MREYMFGETMQRISHPESRVVATKNPKPILDPIDNLRTKMLADGIADTQQLLWVIRFLYPNEESGSQALTDFYNNRFRQTTLTEASPEEVYLWQEDHPQLVTITVHSSLSELKSLMSKLLQIASFVQGKLWSLDCQR